MPLCAMPSGAPDGRGERESVPLGHLHLPDDLFDGDDPEQAAIKAGDRNDALGIWRGRFVRLLLDSHAV